MARDKLRKGDEKKLNTVLCNVEAAVGGLEGSTEALHEARNKTARSAAKALSQINKLFGEFAQHRDVLAETLRPVRKDAAQPVTDADNILALLKGTMHYARLSVGDESKAANEEGAEHIGFALEPMGPLNTARRYHAAAVVKPSNHVFVVGGEGRNGACVSRVERLKHGSSEWELTGLPIPAHVECGACAVGTTVVVAGGERDGVGYLDIVDAVDTVTGASKTLPPLPQKLTGCGVASVLGKVIVTGGFAGGTMLDAVWALDIGSVANAREGQRAPLQWQALSSLSEGRMLHGATAGGGCVFVCAGVGRFGLLKSCAMLRVTVGGAASQETWEHLPALPKCMFNCGCCYGGGNVFVAGGPPNALQGLFALHLGAKRWARVGGLGYRKGGVVVCVERRVIVLGGFNDYGCMRSCEVFDF